MTTNKLFHNTKMVGYGLKDNVTELDTVLYCTIFTDLLANYCSLNTEKRENVWRSCRNHNSQHSLVAKEIYFQKCIHL